MKRFEWGTLSRKGMPRPMTELGERLAPVPWSQDKDGWGVLNTGRAVMAQAQSLCLLCGEAVEQGSVIIEPGSAANLESYCAKDLGRTEIVDKAPLHDRCLILTIAHCPHIKIEWQKTLFSFPYKAAS